MQTQSGDVIPESPDPTPQTQADAVVNESSVRAFQQELQATRDSLPPNKQRQFDEAMGFLVMNQLTDDELAGMMDFSEHQSKRVLTKLKPLIAGKTADEIIVMGGELKPQIEARKQYLLDRHYPASHP